MQAVLHADTGCSRGCSGPAAGVRRTMHPSGGALWRVTARRLGPGRGAAPAVMAYPGWRDRAELMADMISDAKGEVYRRVEVLTGPQRRPDWSADEKARVVAEICVPGAVVSEVARR